MINGDETSEGVSEVASVDPLDASPLWHALKVDVGSAASSARYSSCGESEFERYCSANSAMGTPSMCSTITMFNDCSESEYGYARHFGFNDGGELENFSLGGSERNRLDTNVIESRRIELREEVIDGEPKMKYGSSGLNFYETGELIDSQEVGDEILCWKVESASDLFHGAEMNNGSEKSESSEDENEGSMVGKEASKSRNVVVDAVEGAEAVNSMKLGQRVEEHSLPYMVDKQSDGVFDHIEDGMSRNEHSESEDSLYNTLSDNERKDETFLLNRANENPLLINSSVAFGSDDWNVYECETQGCSLNSFTMDAFQEIYQNLDSSSLTLTGSPTVSKTAILPTVGKSMDVIEVRDIPVASCQVQADLNDVTSPLLTEANSLCDVESEQDAKDIFVINNQTRETDRTACISECSVGHTTETGTVIEEVPIKPDSCVVVGTASGEQFQIPETEDDIGIDCQVFSLTSQAQKNLKENPNPLVDVLSNRLSTHARESCENIAHSTVASDSKAQQPTFENQMLNISSVSTDLQKDHLLPVELAKLDLNDFHYEIVHEMEEILLDNSDSPGARFSHDHKMSQFLPSLPSRDGGSTASISGTSNIGSFNQQALKIDGVEVIGARQKRGDVSFSERLVGVKEYTIYLIRVWSGKEQWVVERRYRDFYSLYYQLKSFFADRGLNLPSPWSLVENRSRKIFGSASPDIVEERSVVIQECLCSVLHSRFLITTPAALIWFLSPQESNRDPPALGTSAPQSPAISRVNNTLKLSSLGKTISLGVEIRPYKSTKQMLELQHYTCAGCHRHFDDQKTLMKGFVQTFGWGKPRFCEYTYQLFCSSCHTNEMAVIPARVLHHWDFTRYPVSQLAKSYLDSIHDQPMLCVSAVNPFLFSKVQALLHVMNVRKKIGNMISYVHCPFRKSINRGLGSRRYLIESNDFFALRDLIDLSKGAFAALPTMLETVERKILEHIVEKCLVCCDVGVSCGARQLCCDPLSLIFPFQESEVEKCTGCETVFHKACFGKLSHCPCGACLGDEAISEQRGAAAAVNSLLAKSTSILPLGSLSGLFAKSIRTKRHADNENIILMGSLPSTSL